MYPQNFNPPVVSTTEAVRASQRFQNRSVSRRDLVCPPAGIDCLAAHWI